MRASASSSTSSRTSTSSSTSEPSRGTSSNPAGIRRLVGLLRVVHPFPSVLDALVAAAVAAIAGAPPPVVLRLGVAMLALQGGIGTANDLLDAPDDALVKPWKPIPAGAVGEPTGRTLMVALFAVGLALSALSGVAVLTVAVLGTAIGLAYDLRLKGTPWSWLPFALGVPLLPLFGWLGAGAPVAPELLLALGVALPAGAALAVANAVADVGADIASGRESVATALGTARAWTLGAALQGAVSVVAVVTLFVSGSLTGRTEGAIDIARVLALAGSIGVVALGLGLGRSADASRARRGWELQAVGLAWLAVAWLVSVPIRP